MKITLITVGSAKKDYIIKGVRVFSNRISKYIRLDHVIAKDARFSAEPQPERMKQVEGTRILEILDAASMVVVLDEHGKGISSMDLSQVLGEYQVAGKDITFIVGGAYGLDQSVIQRADMIISLSPMTLTHEMAQLVLFEQIYRSFTILNNEPYHH